MSLPQFDVQGSLFESLGAIAPELFADNDKYKLFAKKVWPVLASCREQLLECYDSENGRPGVEPVVLLGVLIFQFLERAPDRQAVEMVKYHLGWKLALHLEPQRSRLPSDDVGVLPAALTGARQKRSGLWGRARNPATGGVAAQTLPPTAGLDARGSGRGQL